MRTLARAYLQHGTRHLPQGSDPIPGQVTPSDFFTASYAVFERAYTSVASGTPQVFDLSTASAASSNEHVGALAGTSWTGTNFSYDTSDPNYLHILTPGVYMYEAAVWYGDGSTTPSGAFTAIIQETGSIFSEGAGGASTQTFSYIDPSFDPFNITAYRQRTYFFVTGSIFPGKRGITFAHTDTGALDCLVTMVVFRVAPVTTP